MRPLRRLLVGLAVMLSLLLAAIWIVPGMLDWDRYRDEIASLAAAGIGRPVRIGGAVTLHLLPEPVLTAAGIAVEDSGDGVVLTARELRLRVALGPLLAGRVDARDLVLRGADLLLPWPPAPGALAQRPPTWLSGLQARVEDSRIQVGGVAFTGISAGLQTDPDTGTLSSSGIGTLGARVWRFTARLGRPGYDSSATLDVSLDGQGRLQDTGGTFSGSLAGDGSLSGRVAGRGPDLSGLMPAPALPWRADGRLSAASGLAVADELALSVGGVPARGAVALRVLPDARLDLSLAAGQLDLDAWLPVLARGAVPTLPTGIDLSAEAATFAGGTLRRVRAGFDLDAGGVTLRDGQALLPGNADVTLSGRLPRGEGVAFEGAVQLAAPDLRTTLNWMAPLLPPSLAPAGLPRGVLQSAALTARLQAGPGIATLADLQGSLDGSAVAGTLTVRTGPRLGLSAGLTLDRLALDPWMPDPGLLAGQDGLSAVLAHSAAADADLRLQVGTASLHGLPLGRLVLDAQSDTGRLILRRLEAAPLGARLTASGTVGEGGRLSDATLDLAIPDLAAWAGLAPPGAVLAPLLRGPGTLTLSAAGPPDAVALRVAAEGGGIRLEAQPTLALASRRLSGPVSLHHPGAPRLLETLGLPGTAPWLGDGSFSLLAQVTAAPGQISLGRFGLVAGALRASGQLALDGRRLSGAVTAETLPLPLPYARSRDPLPVWVLQGWDAAVRVDADQVLLEGAPGLQTLSADLVLRNGVLVIQRLSATLHGGALSATATLDGTANPPTLALAAQLQGLPLDTPGLDTPVPSAPVPNPPPPGVLPPNATPSNAPPPNAPPPVQSPPGAQTLNSQIQNAPVLDTQLDLTSGTLGAKLDLQAIGYSPAALLSTAAGTATLDVSQGALTGLDLPAISAALVADPAAAVTTVRTALTGGKTPFRHLDLAADVRRGTATLTGHLTADAGELGIGGTLDLAGPADIRLQIRPAAPAPPPGPELGLLFTGPMAAQRTPELAGLLRWLAARP